MSRENPSQEIVIAHIPVFHAGYMDLLDRHGDADVGVLGQDILQDFSYLRKEIRALTPEQAVTILQGIGRSAVTLSREDLIEIPQQYEKVVMPSDDISRVLAQRHFDEVEFEPVFLRWDRDNTKVNTEVSPDEVITLTDVPGDMIERVMQEASKNSSWWRQVGAVLLSHDGTALLQGHNSSLPTEYSNWIDGDPRNTVQRGQAIDLSIDIHAEARLIAQAAREGIALEGASICVSTFPCPNCAKMIAESGLKNCYFIEGYAMLDGYSVLKNADVKIIKIDDVTIPEDQRALRPYPTSS